MSNSTENNSDGATGRMILPLPAAGGDPQAALSHFKQAESYLQQNDFYNSMRHILEILRYDPANPHALNSMGVIFWGLYRSGASLGELATQYIKHCIRHDPQNRQAVINLISMLHELYQSHKAKELCKTWLTNHPDDGDVAQFYNNICKAPNLCIPKSPSRHDIFSEENSGDPDQFGVFVGSAQHKLAYLVINKCACSTFRDWILSLDYSGNGASLNNYHTRHDNHFTFNSPKNRPPKDFFKFTFVRNPFRRVLSFYSDRILSDPAEAFITHEAPQYKNSFKASMSFADFVRALSDFPHARMEQHLAPQSWFLFSDSRLVVDFIGRLETIKRDFQIIQSYTGSDTPLPHKRKTTSADHRLLYTEETAAVVYEKYALDFRLLGYEADSWKMEGV